MPEKGAKVFIRYPELEMVLCCLRTNTDIEISSRVKELISRGVNWSTVIDIAKSSRVVPLLYRNLKYIHPDGIPESVWDQLKKYFSENLHENLHLFRELQSILRLFDASGITTICYKGPVFAQWLYGDLSLRESGDLDILVRKNDVLKAKELILSKGYHIHWPTFLLNSRQEAAHIDAKYNYTFVNETTGVILELHWGITPKYFSFPPEPEWLWKQLETWNIGSTEVHSFSPEDYLLILCVHGSNHCWIRLSWICDISELIIRYPNLNWDYVLHEANNFGVERILLLGLFITHEFLGTKLNEVILQKIKADPRVNFLEKQVARKFLENDFIGSSALEIPIFHLRMRERFSDKVRYCINMGNPSSKDWAIFPKIPANSVIFFILRPFRLLIEHGVVPLTRRLRSLFLA